MDKSLISRNRDVMSGSYVIRGTRLTVKWIRMEFWKDGWSARRIAREHRINEEQVTAALHFRGGK